MKTGVTPKIRKIIKASTRSDLMKFVENSKKQKWYPISDVKEFDGRYEVLVEREDWRERVD